MLFVGSGSIYFSCLSPSFAASLGLRFSFVFSSITLGDVDSKAKHIGFADKFNIINNNIISSHKFEIFEFNSIATFCIDFDLMLKLKIFISGLAANWESNNNPITLKPIDP